MKTNDLAYSLWEKAGYPAGCELDFWLRAEAFLEGQEAAITMMLNNPSRDSMIKSLVYLISQFVDDEQSIDHVKETINIIFSACSQGEFELACEMPDDPDEPSMDIVDSIAMYGSQHQLGWSTGQVVIGGNYVNCLNDGLKTESDVRTTQEDVQQMFEAMKAYNNPVLLDKNDVDAAALNDVFLVQESSDPLDAIESDPKEDLLDKMEHKGAWMCAVKQNKYGRITVPASATRRLGLKPSDRLYLYNDGKKVIGQTMHTTLSTRSLAVDQYGNVKMGKAILGQAKVFKWDIYFETIGTSPSLVVVANNDK